MKLINCITTVVLCCCFSVAFSESKYNENTPYYFGDYKHYFIPYQPIEELSLDAAISRTVYYIAYFDSNNKILKFKKIYKNVIEFTDMYYYRDNGTLYKRVIKKKDGKEITHNYNENGELIKGE